MKGKMVMRLMVCIVGSFIFSCFCGCKNDDPIIEVVGKNDNRIEKREHDEEIEVQIEMGRKNGDGFNSKGDPGVVVESEQMHVEDDEMCLKKLHYIYRKQMRRAGREKEIKPFVLREDYSQIDKEVKELLSEVRKMEPEIDLPKECKKYK